MSEPVETRVTLLAAALLAALAVASPVLLIGSDAFAGVAVDDAASAPAGAGRIAGDTAAPPAPAAPAASAPATAGGRRLQCWQDGRLLIDAAPVDTPKPGAPDARVVVLDRDGQAIVVTDAGRATCITRPDSDRRPKWPMAPWAW